MQFRSSVTIVVKKSDFEKVNELFTKDELPITDENCDFIEESINGKYIMFGWTYIKFYDSEPLNEMKKLKMPFQCVIFGENDDDIEVIKGEVAYDEEMPTLNIIRYIEAEGFDEHG